jgi:hypothetical protein
MLDRTNVCHAYVLDCLSRASYRVRCTTNIGFLKSAAIQESKTPLCTYHDLVYKLYDHEQEYEDTKHLVLKTLLGIFAVEEGETNQ